MKKNNVKTDFMLGFATGIFIVFTIFLILTYAPTTHHADVNNIVTHQEPILNFSEYKQIIYDLNLNYFNIGDLTISKNPILFNSDSKWQ